MERLSHLWPLRLARSLADRPDGEPSGVEVPVYSDWRPMQVRN